MTRQLWKHALELVEQMTLKEEASLCSGKSFWESKVIERLGLRPIILTDGPTVCASLVVPCCGR